MPVSELHAPLLTWYAAHARDLPWRCSTVTPWEVLVSEVMLQQTPVARVEPVWRAWTTRWPAPADLAAEVPAEAIRAWGRLGYPRRALRLHAAAAAITARHAGRVPSDVGDLVSLPGVGAYTAAAVAAFAYGRRAVVVDTNVRRVLARLVGGTAGTTAGPSAADRRAAQSLLPEDGEEAAAWSVAVMELGAVVCSARVPRCTVCPVAPSCRWLAAGRPPDTDRLVRRQPWGGTDRQVRGRLLAALRDSPDPVPLHVLADVWPDDVQRSRCLQSLVVDGLAETVVGDLVRLPQGVRA